MADLQAFLREHQTAAIGVGGAGAIALLLWFLKRQGGGNTQPGQFTPIQGIGSYITGYPTANNPPSVPIPPSTQSHKGTGLNVPELFKGAAPPMCPIGSHPQFYRGHWRCEPNAHHTPPAPPKPPYHAPPIGHLPPGNGHGGRGTGPTRVDPFAPGVDPGNLYNAVTVGKGKVSMKAMH